MFRALCVAAGCLACIQAAAQLPGRKGAYTIGKLQYDGGGDWYANPSSLPNLLDFLRSQSRLNIAAEEQVVSAGSPLIYQFPVVYLTGHGNVVFTAREAENLRRYCQAGGFLFLDDNYGLQPYIRRELQKIFPGQELVEVPFSHPIYHQQWDFPQGLPKIHEHDGKPAQGFGIFLDGRLAVFLTYECDLGDGWEDPSVHKDPPEVREKALRMGANVLLYALRY